MISHIQFYKGYATKLANIGTKRFDFKPGINVLFGPNGCGKSTILKTAAAYCAIPNSGWTTFSDSKHFINPDVEYYPHNYAKYSPGNCVADVGWDGTPTLFNALDHFNDFQIIISTHSPLILFKENINIIDVEEGYANECIQILINLFAQIQ